MSTRRAFLGGALALPAFACTPRQAPATATPIEPAKPPAPKGPRTMLVLGGTRFLGPAVVDAALAQGWKVTLFNRGKSAPHLYPELEKLIGDRDPKVGDGLKALEGRTFDAVVDTSGYFPRHVAASAELLAEHVGHYVFISSVSAYAKNDEIDQTEDAQVAVLDDPTVETMGEEFQNYGGLKVLCEKAAEAAMPGRVSNVRPGYIVGPDDPTDRFTYWPVRVAAGGEVLAPGTAKDPIQIIDVRDLGEFIVKLCADKAKGVFNAVGPEPPIDMGELLASCQRVAGTDIDLAWVDATFLEAESKKAPVYLPIWVPPHGETVGFHRRSNARAIAAGLRFRALDDTVRATLEWWNGLPEERKGQLRAGIPREMEAELITRFRGSADKAA
jgi:2'-hydroxyisoflavone reductase